MGGISSGIKPVQELFASKKKPQEKPAPGLEGKKLLQPVLL